LAVLVGVVLGIVRCWRLPVALALLLLLLGGVALIFGETRVRVRYIGAGAFYSSEPLVEIPGIAFFQGFHVSPRLREVVEEVEEAVVDYGAQSEDGQLNVFFGPRMEFAYAAFRIQSPTQLPIWYHPGNSFPEGQIQAVSDSWLSHQFDVCIFLRAGESADFTYMPPDIVHSIETEYQRVDYPEIVVFTKE
jgi:hypothetical protein